MGTDRRQVLARQARLLAVPAVRTMSWIPLAAAVALCALALFAASRAHEPPPDGNLAVAGALLAVWFASLLGDRSAVVADATPPHLLFRRAIRLAVGLPIVALLWIGALSYAAEGPYTGTLSLLFGAEVLVALAIAAAALHAVDPGREALWAAGGLFMVFIALPFGLGIDVSPIPMEDTWWLSVGRWLTLAGAGAAVFVLASLDPAGRRPHPIASLFADPMPRAAR